MRAEESRIELDGPIELIRTLRRFAVWGQDATFRVVDGSVWTSFWTPEGAATVHYEKVGPRSVLARAFGPGAQRALMLAPDHLGAHDRSWRHVFEDPWLASLAERHRGFRFGRTRRAFERLVPVILAQKVTAAGASRSYRELLYQVSEDAPGPQNLRMPVSAEMIAQLAYYDLHRVGVERKRAETILRVTRDAARLESLVARGPDALDAHLARVRGIGPWTRALVRSAVFGDPDTVIVGDYHLPSVVSYALADEPRGDDARMLELLEPFRPLRGRALALIASAGKTPPRYGPRLKVRDIRRV